jgi:uncharacterized Ntn-hydrolase superfamily protein
MSGLDLSACFIVPIEMPIDEGGPMKTNRGAALVLASLIWLSAAAATEAPQGVHHATFSLCAIDPATGESGVVVTTRVPFVGRAVPWARAGVGAVATQSWTIVEYGRLGLDLLEQGVEPAQAIERLLADDAGRELRQLGLIDMEGRTASFTGEENNPWAGSREGEHFTVQGNILVGREVVDAVADHFESTASSGMPLAERMILALESGQRIGGDKRWGNFQSAAIRIADPNDPGRGGDHLSLSIDVGEHPSPVQEMKRIYYATTRRLGHRGFSEIQGPDVVELKRKLQALGYGDPEAKPIPDDPDFDVDRKLSRSDPARFQELVQDYRKRQEAFLDRHGRFDTAVIRAVDAFREAHGLDHPGNPRGLVDAALVAALNRELLVSRRGAE